MKRRRRLQGSAIIHPFWKFRTIFLSNDLATLKHWLILQLNIFPKLKKPMQLVMFNFSIRSKQNS
jgi:hypothetical protein